VLGVLGIGCFWILTGIPAIFLGLSAKKEIRSQPDRLSGNGLASAGIVTGICGFIFSLPLFFVGLMVLIAVPNFYEAQTRAKVARSKSEIRTLSVGLETYYVDCRSYPPRLSLLTTPIAYVTSIPIEPFAAEESEDPFDYRTDLANVWILRSTGPDRDSDVDLQSLIERTHDSSELRAWYQSFEYDPTNGIISSGDIFRAGP